MSQPPLDAERVIRDFSGVVPLFPLPSLVLFPDVVAPLLIFEDRYRQMTTDALAGEKLIGMALLRPGWETQYEGAPAIEPHVCVGSIVSHEQLPDGRYKLLLYGLFRAEVVEEVQAVPYRKARVKVRPDEVRGAHLREVDERLHQVLAMLPGRRGRVGRIRALATQVRGGGGGPGRIADAAAEVADLEPAERYRILSEPDVLRRLATLADILEVKDRDRGALLPPRADPSLN